MCSVGPIYYWSPVIAVLLGRCCGKTTGYYTQRGGSDDGRDNARGGLLLRSKNIRIEESECQSDGCLVERELGVGGGAWPTLGSDQASTRKQQGGQRLTSDQGSNHA